VCDGRASYAIDLQTHANTMPQRRRYGIHEPDAQSVRQCEVCVRTQGERADDVVAGIVDRMLGRDRESR
jgi:hypothetical protein